MGEPEALGASLGLVELAVAPSSSSPSSPSSSSSPSMSSSAFPRPPEETDTRRTGGFSATSTLHENLEVLKERGNGTGGFSATSTLHENLEVLKERGNVCSGGFGELFGCPPLHRNDGASDLAPDDIILWRERAELAARFVRTEDDVCCENDTSSCSRYMFIDVMLAVGATQTPRACRKDCACWTVLSLVQACVLVYGIAWSAIRVYNDMACAHEFSEASYMCDAVQAKLAAANLTSSSDKVNLAEEMRVLQWTNTSVGGIRPDIFGQTAEDFLAWRAITSRSWALPRTTQSLVFALILMPPFYYAFGTRFNNPDEILYPALLFWQNGDGRRRLSVQKPRRLLGLGYAAITPFVMLLALVYIISSPMVSSINGSNHAVSNQLAINTLLCAVTFALPFNTIWCGIAVQIRNASVLAQSLGKVRTTEQFEEWRGWFKAGVGALHIWSWRVSPLIAGVTVFEIFSVITAMINLLSVYFTVANHKADLKALDNEYANFQSRTLRKNVSEFFVSGSLLVAQLLVLSLIGTRYKRILVLTATLQLEGNDDGNGGMEQGQEEKEEREEETEVEEQEDEKEAEESRKKCETKQRVTHLDDLEVLLRYHSTFTLFDIPIRTTEVATALKIVFVSILSLLIAAVAAE